MMFEIINRLFLTVLELIASPVIAVCKCIAECWEDTARVALEIGPHKGTIRVGTLNSCLFTGVSNTSLSRVKGSLAKGDRLLNDKEIGTLPGGKVRRVCVEIGAFKPQVEAKLLKALGVKPAEKK